MNLSSTMSLRGSSSSSTMSLRGSSSSSTFFSISPKANPNINRSFFHLNTLKPLKCIQSPSPDSNPSKSVLRPTGSPFSCSALTFSPTHVTDISVPSKFQRLITEFRSLSEPIDRVKRLLHYSGLLLPLDDSSLVDSNRVMGCTVQVWLEVKMDEEGRMRFAADSDSEITRGFCFCLISVLDGAVPEEVLKVKTEDLADLNVGLPGAQRSRVNTWHNVLISMQKKTKALVADREGKVPFDPFPSLVITADGSHAEAQGSFSTSNKGLHFW